MSHSLATLGWNDEFQRALDALGDPELCPARVASVDRGQLWLLGSDASRWIPCAGPLGARGHDPLTRPTVGDWIAIRDGVAVALLPRRTRLLRRAPGGSDAPQLIAANLDLALIVTAVGRELNSRRLERYLAAVWDGGAEPVLAVNKIDLPHNRAALGAELGRIAPTARQLWLSATAGQGMEQVEALASAGRTVALIGSSGVGKSTILNRLLGTEVAATGPVRSADGKGRHTTTRRDLKVGPSGALVIDTPGMRELGLWNAGRGVDATYPEVADAATRCRFRDCGHGDEPGCALRAGVATGELAADRVAAYQRLQAELAEQPAAPSPRAKRRWRAASKAMRRFYRDD